MKLLALSITNQRETFKDHLAGQFQRRTRWNEGFEALKDELKSILVAHERDKAHKNNESDHEPKN